MSIANKVNRSTLVEKINEKLIDGDWVSIKIIGEGRMDLIYQYVVKLEIDGGVKHFMFDIEGDPEFCELEVDVVDIHEVEYRQVVKYEWFKVGE